MLAICASCMATPDRWAVRNSSAHVRISAWVVGGFVADVVVADSVKLELKSVRRITVAHEIQLANYLIATGTEAWAKRVDPALPHLGRTLSHPRPVPVVRSYRCFAAFFDIAVDFGPMVEIVGQGIVDPGMGQLRVRAHHSYRFRSEDADRGRCNLLSQEVSPVNGTFNPSASLR